MPVRDRASGPKRRAPPRRSPAREGTPLRRLLRCESCFRVFEAGPLAAGDRFHCSCGAAVTVPSTPPHEARVVRCSACGSAKSAADAAACDYCGARFDLAERDRNTLCPSCSARVSDSARFCHSCGTFIASESIVGAASALPCPACADGGTLVSRRTASDQDATMYTCRRCVGLWLEHEQFALLKRRALASAEPEPLRPPRRPDAEVELVVYRPCPVCTGRMHRKQFAARSGVVLDVCLEHGLWFDAQELDRVLDWVREGGLAASGRIEATRRAELRRATAPSIAIPPAPDAPRLPVWLELLVELADELVTWLR